MKQKWLDLTWPQRVMILIQTFLILLFLILSCTVGRQQVIPYQDEYLRCRTNGEVTTYSGRIDGQKAVFTVSPGPVVEYRRGDTLYGPYTILFDSTAVSDSSVFAGKLIGVEVWEKDTLLFRGGYLPGSTVFPLFDENGENYIPGLDDPDSFIRVEVAGSEKTAADYTPGVTAILRVALEPDVVRRGSFGIFLLGVLVCVLCAVSILYADALFRFQLSFRIQDPEDAEPSGWELFSRWIGWIAITIAALVIFIIGLNCG